MPNLNYNYLPLLILISLLPIFTRAQTVFEGQVINNVTELPIPGVTVKLLKQNVGTQTNGQGCFGISVENAAATLNASNTALNEVRVTAGKVKPYTYFMPLVQI
jgi:hypothetical protein